MATFIAYQKMTKEQIESAGKDFVKQATDWFAANPKRKTANAEFVYGRIVKIRRGYIQVDVDKAVEDAIKG